MEYDVVIDTNILVSALLAVHKDSSPVRIIRAVFEGRLHPFYDEDIMLEYREVLNRRKFGFSRKRIEDLLEAFFFFGKTTERVQTGMLLPDEKDLVFYEVAKAKDNIYLVTGNKKHFPEEPSIVTPNEMLDLMEQDER